MRSGKGPAIRVESKPRRSRSFVLAEIVKRISPARIGNPEPKNEFAFPRPHSWFDAKFTHDIDVVRAMAHRIIVMKDSEVVESGPIDRVLDDSQSEYTRRLIAAGYA